jgi:hypothetical protein
VSASVRGTVRIDGQPVIDQPVLLVTRDPVRVVSSANTDSDGRFELAVPGENSDLLVLARITTPVLDVAAADAGAGSGEVDLSVDTSALVAVSCRFVVDGRRPPFVSLAAEPVRLDGIPDEWLPALRRRSVDVVDAHFFSRNLDAAESVELLVRPGSYRFDAGYIDRSRPNLTAPDFDNLVTSNVTAVSAGSALRQSGPAEVAAQPGGTELEITGPCTLDFHLRVLPDAELLG